MDEQLRFDADHEAEKINATLAAHDDDYDSDSDSSDGHVYSFAEDDVSVCNVRIGSVMSRPMEMAVNSGRICVHSISLNNELTY
jgi:hypothetical protein